MRKKFILTGIIAFTVTAFSFLTKKPPTPDENVKSFYLQQAKQFENEIIQLQRLASGGNEKILQHQFLKTKLVYKQIEAVVEYYFGFSAIKLNGPSIPFFEEEESDVGRQEPAGMQVIEGIIFPGFKEENSGELKMAIENLLADARAMIATNESFAFTGEFIFDAVTEEMFRISALGIAGFDSQTSGNGLPECGDALAGVQKILSFYTGDMQHKLGNKNQALHTLLNGAKNYLRHNSDFNAFNRIQFIFYYLNPATKIIGEYKQLKGFGENKSPMYYSTIKKNGTLFAAGAFDVNKYLDDNTISTEKITLGKKLFFDTQLSKANTRSCATCHNPQKGFTDGLSTSVAVDGHSSLPRNAPTLWNAALQRNMFWDNRSPSLEDQVMRVLNNADEMHGSAEIVAEKILNQKDYAAMYRKAYKTNDKAYAALNICNAIACYERTLISLNSKFDKQMRGQAALSQNEINGFNLFIGKAKCGTCHFMPLFSGAKPPRYYYNETEVIGVPATAAKVNASLDKDQGRFLATGLPLHKFAFKTPTLRNIALTAPYMHNGVFKTLDEVMEFYNNGGGAGLSIAPVNQSLPVEKLKLSATEIRDIVSFLKALTDTSPVKAAF